MKRLCLKKSFELLWTIKLVMWEGSLSIQLIIIARQMFIWKNSKWQQTPHISPYGPHVFKWWTLKFHWWDTGTSVTDGVKCFTYKREIETCLLILNELTKFDSKCDSDLRRFNGKVHFVIYCIEDRVSKTAREIVLFSHEIQKGPPCFLNFLMGVYVWLDPDLVLDLVYV